MMGYLAGFASGALVLLVGWSPHRGQRLPAGEGFWPSTLVRRRVIQLRVERRLLAQMPATLDLIGLAIGAGETVAGALRVVSDRGGHETGRSVATIVADLDSGVSLDAGLRQMPGRMGESYRPVSRVLRNAVAEGASVGELFMRLGDEAHTARKLDLERRARQVPVMLLFPLVALSLPALIIGALIPLIIVSLS